VQPSPHHRDRLQIAYLVGEYPSKSETFIKNQIEAIADAGHDVEVFAFHSTPGYSFLGIHLHDLRMPKRWGPRLWKAAWLSVDLLFRSPRVLGQALNFRRYGRHIFTLAMIFSGHYFLRHTAGKQYTVMHAQFGPFGNTAVHLRDSHLCNCPIVTSFRGSDISSYVQRAGVHIYDRLFRIGARFLPVANYFSERLRAMGCPPDKITVLHSGIDTAPITQLAKPDKWRTKTVPLRLVSVGRLVEKKGFDLAIRALAHVLQTEPAWDIEYHILGDGPLRSTLEQLVSTMNLARVVHFEGWQPYASVQAALRSAHCLVAPSQTSSTGDIEGIPNVVKEAMAQQIPVIASNHSGMPEAVINEGTGYLFAEGNVEE